MMICQLGTGTDWDQNSARDIINTESHLYCPMYKLTKMLSNLS